jgi:hypothetical protein
VSGELYHTARAFRIFTMERRQIDPDRVLAILEMEPHAARQRLASPQPLL